ncbi:hypothetical protein GCM10022276_06260 [Sphingomonas limnosediminicola]|uniref:Uncharacterized protein n=1 Tax=Sphingomonas limnosediminicola TaxID=940133 RepID=A0ABP7KZY4_9SPHN
MHRHNIFAAALSGSAAANCFRRIGHWRASDDGRDDADQSNVIDELQFQIELITWGSSVSPASPFGMTKGKLWTAAGLGGKLPLGDPA